MITATHQDHNMLFRAAAVIHLMMHVIEADYRAPSLWGSRFRHRDRHTASIPRSQITGSTLPNRLLFLIYSLG